MNILTKKLFTIRQASEFLGVNPGTIRRWAINKTLIGIKVGTRGDWRFKEQELTKLISLPKVKKEQGKSSNTKKLLTDNADAISDERFRALIEKSSDAIALVTPKGKVTYASPATKGLMGYTPEELKKLTNPFKLAPPDDRKFVTKLFEKLLKKPGSTEHAVYRVLHKNGKHIWIESAMTNLLNDPNVKAVVINYRDITERKLLESQKNDFISIATHELKTPVTSIKAYAQVLQSRFQKEGNTKAVEMLSKMDAQLKKLTGLIGDLLDVTRVDGGKLQFHEGAFDFNELASEIIEEMQLTTTKHPITKKLAESKIVDGDRDRIGQVITNLLSNAIKYSHHNEKIVVTTSGNKKEITLRVQDFGIGIAKGQLDKVFERFFRVGDAEDTYAGLGLGLFISSEIIKRHGGRIWVESAEKKGSTFCFTLPIKRSATTKKDTNTLVEEEKSRPDKKKKVLVADDDPAILEGISLILEDAGYEVKTTVNGHTEKFAQEYAPDVILLDIWMAGMDGRNICRSLKARKLTKHIPVIIISANKDTERIAKEAGADGFLAKPFDMKDLLSTVATYTSKKYV